MRTLSLLVAGLGLALASCVGGAARDNVLLPTAQRVYPNIYENIVRGAADGLEDGDLTQVAHDSVVQLADRLGAVLEAGDRAGVLAIDWTTLQRWATRGVTDMIDDGLISEGVATSLYQRILNFAEVIGQLGAKISYVPGEGRALYAGDFYLGRFPVLDEEWTQLTPHNAPRLALGVPALTKNPTHWSKIR